MGVGCLPLCREKEEPWQIGTAATVDTNWLRTTVCARTAEALYIRQPRYLRQRQMSPSHHPPVNKPGRALHHRHRQKRQLKRARDQLKDDPAEVGVGF